MASSTRWLVIVGVVGAGLVAASLVVALLVDREEELPADRPEGVVQAYLRAAADDDADAALAYFAPDLRDRCEVRQLRDSLRFGADDFRATLREVVDRGETTEVRLGVTEVYGSGPFGRDEYTNEHVFVLEETSEGWRFVEAPWPTWCPDEVSGAPGPVASATPRATAVPATPAPEETASPEETTTSTAEPATPSATPAAGQ